ncbi:Txe/YoeB family addiction module toxin [Vandammella animalimorsus]|uniref:Putative mRNA interferase YoeB n=1 Tax=Vandammella animalimorsus TaxID=2029117 RepID=A0A2A2B272_9BURK|nr:Txe/YoeB family addiction module toxin [Vandammella animalimorsus]MDO5086362.1 Txe/YoeB family addiction module toxin [Comamonadaceae bacterium]PAT44182.1 Txe/YoeB family addiction module toxin [Vandammella animalimorsus]RRD68616.1 Txe/YoeB family addiction module toxin [Comamonadaceae bacterium OH2310_COT-174]
MISFHPQAWDDYLWWQQHDRQVLRKLNRLIRDIQRDPFGGIGKPEALKNELSGFWSRRITDEHRVVYRMEGEELVIAQCRGHYDD